MLRFRSAAGPSRLKKVGPPPWLLHLGSDRWSTIIELENVSVADLFENGGLNDAIARNSVALVGDRQGRLWAARQYGYRIQRFTASGRPLLEIVVDRGRIRQKEKSRGIEIALNDGSKNPADATQNPRKEKGTYFPFTAERVIYGLTEGRDGRIYCLVNAGDGAAALDRYDSVRGVLERIPLSVKLKETFTLAAGRDGLYLAPWNPDGGRWRISWDLLENAEWKPVDGVQIDGFETASAEERQRE